MHIACSSFFEFFICGSKIYVSFVSFLFGSDHIDSNLATSYLLGKKVLARGSYSLFDVVFAFPLEL